MTRTHYLTWGVLFVGVIGVIALQSGAFLQIGAHDILVTAPYLMANGLPLYQDTFINHPPLLPVLMRLLYAFNPDAITNLRIMNVLMVLGTGALTLATAKRLWGNLAGVIATLFYWLWATTFNDLYFYLDAVVGTLSIAMLYVATFPLNKRSLIALGVLAGITAILKQNALGMALMPFVWLLLWRKNLHQAIRNSAIVFGAFVAIIVLEIALLASAGVLEEAVFALFNAGNATWLGALSGLLNGNAWRELATSGVMLPSALWLWWRGSNRAVGGFAWLLLLGAFVLNVPVLGYYHAMAILPILAVWVGFVAKWLVDHAPTIAPSLGIGYATLCVVTAFTPLLGAFMGERGTIGWDELVPISTWLVENTAPQDSVLVLPAYDTNPNLYAQAQRQPPFYMKTWWHHAAYKPNADKLQARVLASPPKYIVWFTDHYASVARYFPQFESLLASYQPIAELTIAHQGNVVILKSP